jgi:hypothetical protein
MNRKRSDLNIVERVQRDLNTICKVRYQSNTSRNRGILLTRISEYLQGLVDKKEIASFNVVCNEQNNKNLIKTDRMAAEITVRFDNDNFRNVTIFMPIIIDLKVRQNYQI